MCELYKCKFMQFSTTDLFIGQDQESDIYICNHRLGSAIVDLALAKHPTIKSCLEHKIKHQKQNPITQKQKTLEAKSQLSHKAQILEHHQTSIATPKNCNVLYMHDHGIYAMLFLFCN